MAQTAHDDECGRYFDGDAERFRFELRLGRAFDDGGTRALGGSRSVRLLGCMLRRKRAP